MYICDHIGRKVIVIITKPYLFKVDIRTNLSFHLSQNVDLPTIMVSYDLTKCQIHENVC